MKKKYFGFVAAFVLGIFVSVSAVFVYASGNTIRSCVRNITGVVRIIGDNDNCTNLEHELSWNIQGPTGPTGPQGPSGASSPFICGGCILYELPNASNKDYSNAYLREAKLDGTNFQNSNFSNSTFYGASGQSVNFSNANMTNSNLRNLVMDSANFSNANLSNAKLSDEDFNINAGWGNQIYTANFQNTNFNGTMLRHVDVENSNFTNAINMNNMNLSYSKLVGSIFTNVNLSNVDFTGSDLSLSNFTNTTRTGIIWTDSTCPDNTLANDHGNTCEGHL